MLSKIPAYANAYVGKRVRVIGPGHYKGRCIDAVGTIKEVWSVNNVAVDLDFMKNPSSSRGLYYFKLDELEFIKKTQEKQASPAEKGENQMNPITNYFNVAVVQIMDDTVAFHTIECANHYTEVSEGSLCVVETDHKHLRLAEVVEIKTSTDLALFCEVVAPVDTSAHAQRIEQRKKTAELKAKMQERAKKLQDLVLYQTLAKEDQEMAQLLQEYQEINK